MRMRGLAAATCMGSVLFTASTSSAQVVLQTRSLRLTIGGDGSVQSLTAKPSGDEYLWRGKRMAMAAVYRGGQMGVGSQEEFAENGPPVYRGGECFPASGASLSGDRLTVRFAEANVTARYQVVTRPQYLALKLLTVEGDPVDRIDLLQLPVKRPPYLGPWINVAYDDRFGICLCAGNIKTNAGMSQHSEHVEMRTVATREVALQGATAVLLGCHDPKRRFLDVMEVVERDFQMPAGARRRRSPAQKHSYLWCSPTPGNVDRYIALAKRAGLRTILFSYTSFTEGAGHFLFNEKYPGGMADLKKVADRIRAAGLRVGLHIHYCKAVKTDPYVTPVPDDRFHKLRTFTLATAIDQQSGTIAVKEDPTGCTQQDGRRILKIGKELIVYGDYTTGPPYRFTGCGRGHLGTEAGPHRLGERVDLLDVDDWTIFIRFDQDTDIQDEAARRIAEIFLRTGPYDLVYFDGAEDVHDPFWYHVANAQHRVYRLLQPRPPVCEAAMSSHFSWHMISRGNAYDVDGRHIKSFCREISCRTAPVRAMAFTRINYGWIFHFYRDMGPDVLEYVLSRGAAWDCPFSIRATLEEVAAHPRAQDCLDVIRTWEDARIRGKLSHAQRTALKTLPAEEYQFIKTWHAVFSPQWVDAWSKRPFQGQEHHLFVNERGQHELVPIRELPGLAGGGIKAYLFQRSSQPSDTYVLLWAVQGESDLALPIAGERVILMWPFGTPLPVSSQNGKALISVGNRKYLKLKNVSTEQAVGILREAK